MNTNNSFMTFVIFDLLYLLYSTAYSTSRIMQEEEEEEQFTVTPRSVIQHELFISKVTRSMSAVSIFNFSGMMFDIDNAR